MRTDPESLEDAQLARDHTGDPQVSVDQFTSDVLDPAEPSAGFVDDLAIQ
jgi:hypothetical protein